MTTNEEEVTDTTAVVSEAPSGAEEAQEFAASSSSSAESSSSPPLNGSPSSPANIKENNNDDDVIPIVEEKRTFGAAASSLLGATTSGRTQGPLLKKLAVWGKQANHNAKDFLSRQRTQWKAPNVVPAGGILGSALSQPIETAELEEPSPTKMPREGDDNNRNDDDGNDEEKPFASVSEEYHDRAISPPTGSDDEENTVEFDNSSPSRPSSTVSAPAGGSRRRMQSADSSQFDEEGSDVSSYYSSTYTESQDGSSFKGTFRWAAASVVDSVQTYRGRYNNANSTSTLASPVPLVKSLSTASSASQTTRILQSRVKDHVAHLMEGLEHHEYIMLLGNGLLGVNLKATFLQNRGVYVDYLVRVKKKNDCLVIFATVCITDFNLCCEFQSRRYPMELPIFPE